MLRLTSQMSKSELCARWDERTSPARFAGNDDNTDNIFMATRKGEKVTLIRKARGAWDPFATIFKGTISGSEDGDGQSVLEGVFTKRVFDYLMLIALAVLDFLFYWYASPERQTGSMKAGCIAFAVLLILLAIPMPSARKRYTGFLRDITDGGQDEKTVRKEKEKRKETGKEN